VAYSRSLERRNPQAAKFLSNIKLDTAMVSEWTRQVIVEKKEPSDVVKAWISANRKIVDSWLGL
jgi:glycine betaine/proline transport system substrate-binding protein